ncbi:MAG: dihydroorotase [Deltaproteobacteria bacterium]|nr:dihydroorotase [Deltaproteobacteria bacterium]MCB9785674.1 dihydroorotase [Deltaproteobacteria bacterium]
MAADALTLARPDDWHLHLRDGEALSRTVRDAARVFGRAIVMPNLVPPVTTAADALAYRKRVLEARPSGSSFEPLMTLYLTERTAPDEIRRARDTGHVKAVKLYPAGATTNSDAGVRDLGRVDDALDAMADAGMPLLVHGEVTDHDVDIFDREEAFIEGRLRPLLARHPTLRVVFEHVTTRAAVAFVRSQPARVAATITAHHLLLNRNDMLVGGVRPHRYCLPVLKREEDRRALLEAATSGDARFFLGSDSAPHARDRKECASGCAGVYTGHAALELYAEAFDQAGALDRLEGFASHFGADFYGLPRAQARVTLRRAERPVPTELPFAGEALVPFRAGETVAWRVESA